MMNRDSLVFAVAGTVFGVLVGWIIGTQQAAPAPVAPAAQTASSGSPAQQTGTPPPFDAARAAELERQAKTSPDNAAIRVELGNLYFDAERFDAAIPWYEAAAKLDPKNVSASTDLAVAYYYTDQVDRALAQIDRSLSADPRHLKTLLNQGIIRAFGKKDLAGAAESWQRVVAISPDSEEGRRAKQGLDGLSSAHQGSAAGGSGPVSGSGAGTASGSARP
jgi:cytochrome c-type biogenesis protein CcmH/NrfG